MPFNPDGSWKSKSGVDYGFGAPKAGTADGDEFTADRDEYVARTGRKPSAGTDVGHEFDKVAAGLGFQPKVIDPTAPGASLDTGAADYQRNRTSELVASLGQQAATGDGAWQKTFSEALGRAQANAQALGQADADVDYGSSLQNIGNAQAAVKQKGVAEGDILREGAKLDARGKLDTALAGQAQLDLGEATEKARIERERRAANQASIDQSMENRKATQNSTGGMFGFGAGGGMSDGGEVPGTAVFGGDDERNDTVPAKLSPDEIVIPRSITQGPDAPRRAAEFVAAVQAGHDPQAAGGDPSNLAEGGGVRPATENEAGGSGVIASQFIGGPFARSVLYNNLRKSAGAGEGGSIDTTQFDETAAQQDHLANIFAMDAAGRGPSIAAPMAAKANNDTMSGALAATTRGKAPQADVLQTASAAGVETAGDAAGQRAREQGVGQDSLSRALTRQRGQQLQLASGQQQAAMQKTLADLGLSLKNQSEVRGAVGAAGQGAAAFAGAGRGGADHESSHSDRGGSHSALETDHSALETDGDHDMAEGGIVARSPTGERLPTEQQQANETAEDRRRRIRKEQEYEEETGSPMQPRREQPKRDDSFLSKALAGVRDFAKKAGTSVRGMAQGGYAGYEPAYAGGYEPVNYVEPGPISFAQPAPVPMNTPQEEAALQLRERTAMKAGELQGKAELETARRSQLDLSDPGQYGAELERKAGERAKLTTLAPRAETAAAPPVPAPAPAPAARHAPGGARAPAVDPLAADADRAEAAAIETQTSVDRELAKAKVESAAAKATATEQAMLQRKEVEQRGQARTAEAMTRWQTASEEAARITATVDPGRFWASRTTGQKVLGWIGMILGAVGAGPDGVNKAAVQLNQAIERDIDAQKAQTELQLKKGAAKTEAAKTFYAMAREATGDELAATDFARAAALEAVALRGEQAIAAIGEPQAKARGLAAVAGMKHAAAQRAEAGKQRLDEHNIKWAHIENERIAAGNKGAGGASAAKEVRDAVSSYQRVAGTVSKLKGLISDTNVVTEKVGARSAQMETIAASLLTEIKDAEHLGALDKGTWELADRLIGDPTATFTLDSTKLAKLDALLEQSRAKAQATIGAVQ